MTLARSLPRSIHGFTLLEVLVAVLVLSVGLLGLAGLQTVGLRQNHSAFMRSQATQLAYDIIDRMRTNKAAYDAGGYDRLISVPFAPPPAFAVDCTLGNCIASNLAAYELSDWITRVRAALPSGDGAVARALGVVTVTVVWDNDRSGAVDAADPSFGMSTEL